jgi:hypothetical protein
MLFEQDVNRRETMNCIKRVISNLVSMAHNHRLMRKMTMEEVEQTILEMPKGKVLGPDGFMTDFIQAR